MALTDDKEATAVWDTWRAAVDAKHAEIVAEGVDPPLAYQLAREACRDLAPGRILGSVRAQRTDPMG